MAGGCASSPSATVQNSAPAESQQASAAASSVPSAAATPDTSPITVSMWLGESWLVSITDPSFKDPVAQEITKRTGVTFDIDAAKTDDPTQELNVMMASGELPDVICQSGDIESKLISGGYVTALDDLIKQYGPDIQKNLGHVMNYWRFKDDGKIYKLRGWVWNTPKYSLSLDVNTLFMRYDILKDIGYTKLDRSTDGNSLITVADYLNVLQQVKDKHPELIPALVDMTTAGNTNAFNLLVSSYGVPMMSGAVYEGGTAKSVYESQNAQPALEFLNQFCNAGWVPKGIATYTKEKFQSLISSGQVFSCLGRVDGLPEAKSALASGDNEEKRMAMFYLIQDPSVTHVSTNGYYIDGDDALFITTNAKNKERIMQFFNWCASDAGSELLGAGIEGVSYTLDASGKKVPTAKAQKAYTDWDSNALKELGLGSWEGLFPTFSGLNAQGAAYDIFQQAIFESNKWSIYDLKDWTHFSNAAYAQSAINMYSADTQSDAYDANSKINIYVGSDIVRAIMAPTKDQCDSIWSDCMKQMKADGLDSVDKALNDNWNAEAKLFGKDPSKLIDIYSDLGINP